MSDAIRVFIGAGKEHWLPTAVLTHSILATTSRPVTVTPLRNHDALIPKDWRRKVPTSFSLQRFLIPQVCEYQGRGIYLDSDQLVLRDIGELWDTPFDDKDRIHTAGDWQSAVMLIDCDRVRWDVGKLCWDMDNGYKRYAALSNLKYESGVTGKLTPWWNWHDRHKLYQPAAQLGKLPDDVRLIHFTRMNTQPWLHNGHPFGHVWNSALLSAIDAGAFTTADVRREIERQNVRPSLALVIGDAMREPDEDWRKRNRKRLRGL